MKLLITGSTGALGRNLLLDERRHQYELMTPTRSDYDLLDPQAVRRMYKDLRPDAVIHLAATVGGIQHSIDRPVRFLVENTLISMNVISEAHSAGVNTLLNIASSCMYPRDLAGTLSPSLLLTAPLEPTNEGYALAKITSWKLAEFIRVEQPERRYVTLIPCNLFGRFDNFHPTYSHMVQSAIVKMVDAMEQGRRQVSVWGNGRARREFMYLEDMADFLWTFLPRVEELPTIMNVGVGEDHTVTEYYEEVARATGYSGDFVYDPSKPHGMERKLVDTSEQTALGWKPKTGLLNGIQKTLTYYLAHREPDARRA